MTPTWIAEKMRTARAVQRWVQPIQRAARQLTQALRAAREFLAARRERQIRDSLRGVQVMLDVDADRPSPADEAGQPRHRRRVPAAKAYLLMLVRTVATAAPPATTCPRSITGAPTH